MQKRSDALLIWHENYVPERRLFRRDLTVANNSSYLAAAFLCLLPICSSAADFDATTEQVLRDLPEWAGIIDACEPSGGSHKDRLAQVASALARTKTPGKFSWAIGARNITRERIEQDLIDRYQASFEVTELAGSCPTALELERLQTAVDMRIRGIVFAHGS